MKKQAAEPRLIKKYANRRLYDMKRRCYITLNDIKQYVIDHINFRVVDAKTQEDLTKITLLQIITEAETSTSAFFTTELLQQMIRLYHENIQNVFGQYFEQALLQFIQHKDLWTNPFTAMKEFNRRQQQFWESWAKKK